MKQRFGVEESPNVLLLQMDDLQQVEGETVKSFVLRFETIWTVMNQLWLGVKALEVGDASEGSAESVPR